MSDTPGRQHRLDDLAAQLGDRDDTTLAEQLPPGQPNPLRHFALLSEHEILTLTGAPGLPDEDDQ